jgi:LmbE family N-acetylglucosaminyl deacetylase
MQWGDGGRVLVVSPHPDDEVLAVGGSMLQLVLRGFSVVVVAVTDGEAAQPHADAATRLRLAAVRSRERQSALESLGLADVTVVRASLADGAVADGEEELRRLLVEQLRPSPPDRTEPASGTTWCLAPWRRDGHPDHEASGRAAVAASAVAQSQLVEFPVWGWQWLQPEDRRFPWGSLRVEPLSKATQRAKRRAIAAFSSQIKPWEAASEPILSIDMLARFDRSFEGFLLE